MNPGKRAHNPTGLSDCGSPHTKKRQIEDLPSTVSDEAQVGGPVLPLELQHKIRDMACRRQDNGHSSHFGFIIVIDVDFKEKIHNQFESSLEAWVWDSLDRAHRALDFDTSWMFVGNVRGDQWHEEMSDDEDGKVIEARENSYQVCVYTEPNRVCAYPLFNYSSLEGSLPVDPSEILKHFDTPPVSVRGISISGVDQSTLRHQWVECIMKDPNEFCRPGRGYMRHPMWTLPTREELSYHREEDHETVFPRLMTQREKSFNFNWPNYPGALGDDW